MPRFLFGRISRTICTRWRRCSLWYIAITVQSLRESIVLRQPSGSKYYYRSETPCRHRVTPYKCFILFDVVIISSTLYGLCNHADQHPLTHGDDVIRHSRLAELDPEHFYPSTIVAGLLHAGNDVLVLAARVEFGRGQFLDSSGSVIVADLVVQALFELRCAREGGVGVVEHDGFKGRVGLRGVCYVRGEGLERFRQGGGRRAGCGRVELRASFRRRGGLFMCRWVGLRGGVGPFEERRVACVVGHGGWRRLVGPSGREDGLCSCDLW